MRKKPGALKGVGAAQAWLVDPLDGTANFVEGNRDWAVMVAFLRGRPDGGVVDLQADLPDHVHRRGRCGRHPQRRGRDRLAPPPGSGGDARSGAQPFLPPSVAAGVDAGRDRFAAGVDAGRDRFAALSSGRRCAGTDYPAVVEGEQDFALFWRTLAWDHAPGVFLLQEAGGVALRPDASVYRSTDTRQGLLAAADASTWEMVHAGILGECRCAGSVERESPPPQAPAYRPRLRPS